MKRSLSHKQGMVYLVGGGGERGEGSKDTSE